MLQNVVCSQFLSAQDHSHGHGSSDFVNPHSGQDGSELEEAAKKKKERAPAYARYKKGFRAMCGYLEQDGRREGIFKIFSSLEVKRPDCIACKPFFSSLSNACRADTKAKKKASKQKEAHVDSEQESAKDSGTEGEAEHEATEADAAHTKSPEPAPLVNPPQREPNAMVLDAISQSFGLIAQDPKINTETYKAISLLSLGLRDTGGKSVAEAEYHSTLSTYLLAPFAELAEASAPPAGQSNAGKAEDKKRKLDDLFSF